MLTPCPECRQSISSLATTCPNCGTPLDFPKPPRGDRERSAALKGCAIVSAVMIVLVFFMFRACQNYLEQQDKETAQNEQKRLDELCRQPKEKRDLWYGNAKRKLELNHALDGPLIEALDLQSILNNLRSCPDSQPLAMPSQSP